MDGEPVSAETWALVRSPIRLDDGDVLMAAAPQVVTFNLVIARRLGEQGAKERRKLVANLKRHEDGNLRSLDPRKDMDCLEDLISTALFAYAALEGFGSHCIDRLPADASVTVRRRGEDVAIPQSEMVARLSVGEKLEPCRC
jgi:hypothetical protein